MDVPELRVHGVSGTPPRDMLYTDPLVAVIDPPDEERARDKYVRVYELPGDRFAVGPNVTAFHWGSLTSGSWLTALWILLLPFSLANVAGWTARRRGPVQVLFVRLFGLFLTGVFLNLALIATVDFYWQWATRSPSTAPSIVREYPNVFAGIVFLLLGWMWWGLVSWASTRGHFYVQTGKDRRRLLWNPNPQALVPENQGPQGDEAWRDPAQVELTDSRIWDVHPILHRLRRIHFGFAYLVLAFSAATASNTGLRFGDFGEFDIPTFVVGLAMVVSVLTLAATGLENGPAGKLLRNLTAWHSLGGACLLVLASLGVIFSNVDAGASEAGHWPFLWDTSAGLLVVCGATLVAIFISAGKVSASAATMGALFGVILGAAAAFMVDDVLGDEARVRIEGLNWAAVAILIWLLVVVLAIVVLIASRATRRGGLWEGIHDATGDLKSVWLMMPVTALALALIVVQQRCARDPSANLYVRCIQRGRLPEVPTSWVRLFILAMFVSIVAVTAVLLWNTGRRQMAALLVVGVGVLYVFLRFSGITIGGIDLSFSDVTATARTIAIVLPAGLIITRMISGIRGSAETRRGVAVLWDVISFWPRWYHPIAPPAYGPHAVRRLRQEIESIQNRTDDATGGTGQAGNRPVIVSSHSQGTVIAVTALGLMAGATRQEDRDTYMLERPKRLDRVGLLTYGCPVGHLYDKYFPSLGFTQLASALADELGAGNGTTPHQGRWANLYRPTDPIGGPLLASIDIEVADPVDRADFIDGEAKESLVGIFTGWWGQRRGRAQPAVVRVYRMHSKYEPIETFVEARTRIQGLLR